MPGISILYKQYSVSLWTILSVAGLMEKRYVTTAETSKTSKYTLFNGGLSTIKRSLTDSKVSPEVDEVFYQFLRSGIEFNEFDAILIQVH
jgi:hypothetical protein